MGTVITLDPDLYEPLDDVIARQPVNVEHRYSYLDAMPRYPGDPPKPRDWQKERHEKLHDYPRVLINQELTEEQKAENEAWEQRARDLPTGVRGDYLRFYPFPHPGGVEYIRKTDSADFERWLFDHRVEEVVTRLREQKKEPEPTEKRPSHAFAYDGSFYGYGHNRDESRVRRYLVNAAIGGASGGTFAVIAHLLLS